MKRFKNGNWTVSNDEMIDILVGLHEAKEKYKLLGLFGLVKRYERLIDKIQKIHDESGSEW